MVRGNLSEKGTFEQKVEEVKERATLISRGKSIPGRWESMCRDPKMGTYMDI